MLCDVAYPALHPALRQPAVGQGATQLGMVAESQRQKRPIALAEWDELQALRPDDLRTLAHFLSYIPQLPT